jgi:hypothetical protein
MVTGVVELVVIGVVAEVLALVDVVVVVVLTVVVLVVVIVGTLVVVEIWLVEEVAPVVEVPVDLEQPDTRITISNIYKTMLRFIYSVSPHFIYCLIKSIIQRPLGYPLFDQINLALGQG